MPRACARQGDLAFFEQSVLDWYGQHKRDLPWRNTTNPYKILVSEMMLQQTQVDRVIAYYELFLHQFPTIADLANAKTSTVITLWSGLGYNRRAILLQKAAQAIVERRAFPKTRDELVEIPGIGPYTAEAILAFAFNRDGACPVDTNIRRIFSRHFFKGKGTEHGIANAIKDAVPAGQSRVWNNALMDFGSRVCTASSPDCATCPLSESCTALCAGTQESYFRIQPPQKRFEGSPRQVRGAIVAALKAAPGHTMREEDIRAHIKRTLSKHPGARDKKRFHRIVLTLERDGLVKRKNQKIALP